MMLASFAHRGSRMFSMVLIVGLASAAVHARDLGQANTADSANNDDSTMFADCLDKADSSTGYEESCIGSISERCMELPGGATTVGMNQCLRREMQLWDGVLNRDYQAIKESQPTEVFSGLREVQRAWIKYRDLKCSYPHVMIKGTMASTMAADCMNTETARRAIDLMRLRQMGGPQ